MIKSVLGQETEGGFAFEQGGGPPYLYIGYFLTLGTVEMLSGSKYSTLIDMFLSVILDTASDRVIGKSISFSQCFFSSNVMIPNMINVPASIFHQLRASAMALPCS